MKKTLLVLGAGASKDFCGAMPLGAELFADIDRHFRLTHYKVQDPGNEEPEVIEEGRPHFLSALLGTMRKVMPEVFNNERELLAIENQIFKRHREYEVQYLRGRTDLPPSVDQFIEKTFKPDSLRPIARRVLKFAIAYLIKGAERATSDRDDHANSNNWIRELCSALSGQAEWQEKLMVFDFNYDRVFEQHFRQYMAADISSWWVNYHHVYGSIGSLDEVPFAGNNDEEFMSKAHEGICLMYEDRIEAYQQRPNHFDLSEVEQVHFLGFGYDEENIKVLGLPLEAVRSGTVSKRLDASAKAELQKRFDLNLFSGRCLDYVQQKLKPTLLR